MGPRGFEPPTPWLLSNNALKVQNEILLRAKCSNQAELRAHKEEKFMKRLYIF